MNAKKKSTPAANFEQALSELETLVNTLEKGELSLEASLEHFEKGMNLSRSCQQSLQDAEQKVNILIEQNGQLDSKPLNAGSE